MKNLLTIAGVLGLSAATGTILILWNASRREVQMSEKPPIVAHDVSIGESASRLNTTITIGFDVIEKVINEKMPPQFTDSGTHRIKTFPFRSPIGPGPVVYVDAKWSILAERGKISISHSGNGVRATVPITVSGWGGLKGDLARLIGVDRKNIRGAIEAFVDVTFDMGEDWCPRTQATPSFRWKSPAELEVVGGAWINVSGKVGDEIQKALNNSAAKLSEAIKCDAIRQVVAKEWKPRSLSVGKVNGSEARLELTPTRAGFSGITYTDKGIQFAIGLVGRNKLTFGESAEPGASMGPLPKLERIAVDDGRIEITLPVELKYSALRKAVMSALPVDGFTGDSFLGKGNVKIDEFNLYTTRDNKLAIGLHVTAKFQKRLFSTSGWLWLTGEPLLDATHQEVSIRDVQFTRQLDNRLVSVVSSLLRDPINHLLSQSARFDLKPKIGELRGQLAEYLNDPKKTPGIRLSVRPDVLGLAELAPGSDSLFIKARFDASASIELRDLNQM